MNALDSPLEALALNYLRCGFLTALNNMWTWLAVFTAAVSFWRIRASSSTPTSDLHHLSSAVGASSPPSPSVSSSSLYREGDRLSRSASSTPFCAAEGYGATKTKFTAVFNEECEEEEEEEAEGEVDGEEDGVNMECGGARDDWERMIGVRKGKMGWYRYQDLAVLDGSVVRLWENCRRRNGMREMVFSAW